MTQHRVCQQSAWSLTLRCISQRVVVLLAVLASAYTVATQDFFFTPQLYSAESFILQLSCQKLFAKPVNKLFLLKTTDTLRLPKDPNFFQSHNIPKWLSTKLFSEP